MKLKLNIRSLALEKELTNANKFGKHLGITSSDMASKLFNNVQGMFSIATLQLLCTKLGCTPNQLFGLPEPLAPVGMPAALKAMPKQPWNAKASATNQVIKLAEKAKATPDKRTTLAMSLPPQAKTKAKPVKRADGKAAKAAKVVKAAKKAKTLVPRKSGSKSTKKGGK